ncbi:ferrous iron transport protein A [Arthrobacter sp. B0490]|uniref:putative acetyltransferase n=1 Tax=Arthrobacter sp. B0490 TaxID=2058891 RepID=UPI000CE55112|nr:ferrous iron transport protein A [Arthrobacter sp. B0490]
MQTPADLLASLPLGTRVVVRRRVEGGFTDSLGDLVSVDAATCTVRTRRGDDVVRLAEVTAAKPVPPAPPRRAPRRPATGVECPPAAPHQ